MTTYSRIITAQFEGDADSIKLGINKVMELVTLKNGFHVEIHISERTK